MNNSTKTISKLLLSFLFVLLISPQGFSQLLSKYGVSFTPKGHLHGLVLFVGFQGATTADNVTGWYYDSIPVWAKGASNQLFDSSTSTIGNNPLNVSAFYKKMSNDSFLFTADVFPQLIMVDTTGSGGVPNFEKMTDSAIKYLNINYPHYNWDIYDNRKNNPDYAWDNSKYYDTIHYAPAQGDTQLDYVILIFRNLTYGQQNGYPGIAYDPSYKLTTDYGGSTKHYALGTYNIAFDGSQDGLTIDKPNDPLSACREIIHETSHANNNAAHTFGANNVSGFTFNCNLGWGMQAADARPFNTANAWEEWYNGWFDNIQTITTNTTATLNDFVTGHDAIRIPMPQAPGQYLFIENHQLIDTFDKKTVQDYPDSSPMASGVFMYISAINKGGNNPILSSNPNTSYSIPPGNDLDSLSNSFKVLSREGNYDYVYVDTFQGLPVFQKKGENPVAGTCRQTLFFPDQHAETIGNITYSFDFNSNLGTDDVINRLLKTTTKKYDYHFSGWGGEGFGVGDKVGVSGIVPAFNFPYIHALAESGPYITAGYVDTFFINGLSVTIASFNPTTKAYSLSINFNDFNISASKRWCGLLSLHNLSGDSAADLNIGGYDTLIIDSNGYVNRLNSEGGSGNSDFINPTYFNLCPGAYIHLLPHSTLIVKHGSTLNLQPGSKILVENGAQLIIDTGAYLSYNSGANIVLNSGSVLNFTEGVLQVADGATFTVSAGGLGHGLVRFQHTCTTPESFNIQGGSTAQFSLTGSGNSDTYLDIAGCGGIDFQKSFGAVTLHDLQIEMEAVGGNQPVLNIAMSLNIDNVNMTRSSGSDPNGLHSGLHIYGQGNVGISYFSVDHGIWGIYAPLFYLGNNKILLNHFTATYCNTGIYTQGEAIHLLDPVFANDGCGWQAIGMSSYCAMNYPSIKYNNIYGFAYNASNSAPLEVIHPNIRRCNIGAAIIGSPVGFYCGNVDSNSYDGIFAGINSSLCMNTSAPWPLGGYMNLSANQNSIFVNVANYLFMDNGYNNLNALSSKYAVLGTLNNSATGLNEYHNFWSLSSPHTPTFGTNYEVYNSSSANPITLTDSFPLSSAAGSCTSGSSSSGNVYVIGGYNGSGGTSVDYPIFSNNKNIAIHTVAFSGIHLDSAAATGMYTMYPVDSATTPNMPLAVNLFSQILIYNYSGYTLTPSNTVLLDFAYLKMTEAVGKGVALGQVHTTRDSAMDSSIALAITTIDTLLHRISPTDTIDYHKKLMLTIDKAGLYRLAEERPDAMAVLDSAASWVHSQDVDLVEKWHCINQGEYSIIHDSMSFEEVDSLYPCYLQFSQPYLATHLIANSLKDSSTATCLSSPLVLSAATLQFANHYSWQFFNASSSLIDSATTYQPSSLTDFTSKAITYTFTPADTGKVTVWVKAISSTGTVIDSIKRYIQVKPLPAANAGSNASICIGSATTIGASSVSGNTYTWTSTPTDPLFIDTTASNPVVSPTITTTYSLTETTPYGCTNANSVIVNVNPLPADNAGGNQTICTGAITTLGAGSVGSDTYVWTSDYPGFTNLYISAPTINPTLSGTYTYTLSETNSCGTSTNTDTVQVMPLPAANAGSDASICSGTSVSIGAGSVGSDTYSWSSTYPSFTDPGISNPVVTPTLTGLYSYTLIETTPYGCTNSSSITITVNPLPVANAGTNQTVYVGDGVALGASAVGGDTYSWSSDYPDFTDPGISDPTFIPTITGTYTFTLTETITESGCDSSNSVIITVIPSPPDFVLKRTNLDTTPYLKCYPNPATGAFTIEYNGLTTGAITLNIFNMMGESVAALQLSQNQNNTPNTYLFNVENYNIPAGMYYVMLKNDKTELSDKILIIKE